MEVIGRQKLPLRGAMPQDVKISPDGRTFYIADMEADGLWILDGDRFGEPSFLRTGKGAHGLYVSRDSREMYISNRGEGTVSVFDFATRRLVKKWRLPQGGSPDMGGVSADGTVLWLSGRYNPRCTRSTPDRAPTGPHQGGERSARARRLPAARPLLPGSHGCLPMTRGRPWRRPATR